MPNLTKVARLRLLQRTLATAVEVTRELDGNRTMLGLTADDPDRWNFVADSLSAAMEPGEMGSGHQVYTTLSAALED